MKNLPVNWFVDIEQEHPLTGLFKDWYDKQSKCEHYFNMKYYGFYNKEPKFVNSRIDIVITLEEWYKCAFGEQFEQGEEVLVKDKNHDKWVSALFVCEYNGLYVADWEGVVDRWDECKKKPSKLYLKIEELKKLAEANGVKLTIISE